MTNVWTDFSEIDCNKIVLKPSTKALGNPTPLAMVSWLNYGTGTLRFKLPPGTVGYPPQPYVPGQTQTLSYQLEREKEFQRPDGSPSLVGDAQRLLVKKITEIEDTICEIIAKDPMSYHPKYPTDKDPEYFKRLLVSTIKESNDPKFPNTIKIKMQPHRNEPLRFQGRNRGKETEILIVEDNVQSAIDVTRDTVPTIFQRGTPVLPVIQAVSVRFLANKITISWRLVYAYVKLRAPRVDKTTTELPVLSASDFYDVDFASVKTPNQDN